MYNDGTVYVDKPKVQYVGTNLKADTVGVRWEWHYGDPTPVVNVSRTIYIQRDGTSMGKQWRIRYPEVAPPGVRVLSKVASAIQVQGESYE